jgi:hypothetical protein
VPASEIISFRNLYNYPNPFRNSTEFSFEHNKLGNILEINLIIYDGRGYILFTKPLNGTYKANRVVVRWDGTGIGSTLIQAGVYYYRLSFNDGTGTKFLTSKLVKF